MNHQYVIGIDLGSRTTKVVQLVQGKIQFSEIFDTGYNPLSRVKETLLKFEDATIMATGYGRNLICEHFNASQVTELKACARGAHFLVPSCRTILDVGGQDCKVISLNENGKMIDFEMNDRCAAGTGKFLEVMAQAFGITISEFVELANQGIDSISITSMCTVFAESEVVALITSGKPKQQIARGLHEAITSRLQSMLMKIPLHEKILFVGGGAKNDCLHTILQKQLATEIFRPPEPQLVVALGAALLAAEMIN